MVSWRWVIMLAVEGSNGYRNGRSVEDGPIAGGVALHGDNVPGTHEIGGTSEQGSTGQSNGNDTITDNSNS